MDQRQYIAFIGSRNLAQFPKAWLSLYREAVTAAVRWGYGVSSGAAVGADQMALEEAVRACGYIRLVLPWSNYEEGWCSAVRSSHPDQIETVVYNPSSHEEWRKSVHVYHPAAARLTRGAFALHARNYGIVEGTQAVVALPSIGDQGGTGQGIRIAQGLGIKLFDLSTDEGRNRLMKKLGKA